VAQALTGNISADTELIDMNYLAWHSSWTEKVSVDAEMTLKVKCGLNGNW